MIYATRPLSEMVPLGEEFREPMPNQPPDEPESISDGMQVVPQGLTDAEAGKVTPSVVCNKTGDSVGYGAAVNQAVGYGLPTAPEQRKAIPLCTGLLDYFPDALAAVAMCSAAGRRQHHPDQPLHWERDKSADHADCVMRHLVDRGKLDKDGERHSAKVAWRALALLQLEIENDRPKG